MTLGTVQSVRMPSSAAHGVVIALLIGLLGACSRQGSKAPAPPPVAVVGGQPISEALFEAYVRQKAGVPLAQLNPALSESLLTELKELKAASLAGEKITDADLEQELGLNRLELLSRRAAVAAGVYTTPTDAELQQAYHTFVASLPASEYHVSHILVATENSAALLIARLAKGAEFARLAREASADESKTRGGDLGWIVLGKLPTEFTDAVKALRPGTFTRIPVRTRYGWHVIRLVETRPASVPPVEQVKAQLSANWQQERYRKFLGASLLSVATRAK